MNVDALIGQVLQGLDPDEVVSELVSIGPPEVVPAEPHSAFGGRDPRALDYDGSRNFGPAQPDGPKVVR